MRRTAQLALVVPIATVLAGAGCQHDWDQWIANGEGGSPVTMPSAGGSMALNSSGQGSSSQSSSTGGGSSIGTCPDESMVAVWVGSHTVCIDRTEVTRGKYAAWLSKGATGPMQVSGCENDSNHTPLDPEWPPMGGFDFPVVFVDWCDASAYCRGNGKRLCRQLGSPNPVQAGPEGEWYGVCSNNGNWLYPYGPAYLKGTCNGDSTGAGAVTVVGALAGCANTDGVLDLSGNVWEWEDGCDLDENCLVRGGAFNSLPQSLRCANPETSKRMQHSVNVGFRCCAEPIPA